MTDNNDDEWNKNYARLLGLNRQHGQAVRLNSSSEMSLKTWLRFQVANLNSNVISDKTKLDKLAAIGYLVRDTNSLPKRTDVAWETKYRELEEFHKIHKHCIIKQKDNNAPLRKWMYDQRSTYQKSPETFPVERKNKLLKLGFNFGSSSNGGGNSLVARPTIVERQQNITFSNNVRFQIVFNSTRLGLSLTKEGNRAVVCKVQNTTYNDGIPHGIQRGDIVTSIGSKSILGVPLKQIMKILAESARPVAVGFERTAASPVTQRAPERIGDGSNLARPTIGPGLPNSAVAQGGNQATLPLPRNRNNAAPHLNSVALDPNKGQRNPEPARGGHQNPIDLTTCELEKEKEKSSKETKSREKPDEMLQKPRSNSSSSSSTIDKENRDVAVRPSTTFGKSIGEKGDAMKMKVRQQNIIPQEKLSSQESSGGDKGSSTIGINKEKRQVAARSSTSDTYTSSDKHSPMPMKEAQQKQRTDTNGISKENNKARVGGSEVVPKKGVTTFCSNKATNPESQIAEEGQQSTFQQEELPSENPRIYGSNNGNENKQVVDAELLEVQALASDKGEENEGIWDLIRVIPATEEKVECRHAGCCNRAVVVWATDKHPEDEWPLCEEHQLEEFGGWPEGVDPVEAGNLIIPQPEDVLLSRELYKHEGYKKLQEMVDRRKDEYQNTASNIEKHKIAEELYRCQCRSGRFLNRSEKQAPWKEAHKDVAIRHIRKMLLGKIRTTNPKSETAGQKVAKSQSNDVASIVNRRNSSVWDTLSDDYRDFLSNICSQEEFEAASFLERDQIFQRYKRRLEQRNEPSRDLKRRKITREEVDNEYGDPYLMALKMMVLQLEDESNELLKLQQQRRNKILRSFAATARISNIDSNSRAIVENDPHLSSMAQTVQLLQKEKERVLRQQKQRKKFLVWAKEIVKHCQEDEDKEGPVNETLFL